MAATRRQLGLSHNKIKSLTTPGRHHDGRGHGLILDVSLRSDGTPSRTWIQIIQVKGGKRLELGLGRYEESTGTEVRALAEENYNWARAGKNPLEERKRLAEEERQRAEAEKSLPTFAEQAEIVYTRDCARWESDDRRKFIRRYLDKHILPAIGDKAIDEIQMSDIDRIVRPIWMTKPAVAINVWGYTKTIFNHCMVTFPHRVKFNPVSDALRQSLGPQNHRPTHYRSVPHNYAREFLALLRANTDRQSLPTRLCLRFGVLTGCRHGESRQMTRDEVRCKEISDSTDWNDPHWDETGQPGEDWEPLDWDDLESSPKAMVWYIPAEHTKMRVARRIPLDADALEVLIESQELHELWGTDLVFPSPKKSHGRLTDGALSRFCRRHEIGGTPHGSRSTFRSWCADKEVPFEVAEIALGHGLPAVVSAYIRSDVLEIRSKLMHYWEQYLRGDLPNDWKWSTVADAKLLKEVKDLTEKIGHLTDQIATFVDLLSSAERRAQEAEARLAEKDLELERLRYQVAPTIEMDLGI